jgi:quercetin dioxygenase-like cupin family protein
VHRVTSLPRKHVVAHDGNGQIESAVVLGAGDFETALEFVEYVELPPATSIGRHTHGDDEELYFVIEGTGRMTLESDEVAVGPGDLVFNPRGGTHALRNDSDGTIRLLVWQVRAGEG